MSQETLEQPAAASSPGFGAALGRAFRKPAFIVVVVVLMTCALGLNAAVSFMQLHFKKEPVPLAHALGSIPDHFGTWVQVSQDKALDKEMQDVLGTSEYIFRDYVNVQTIGDSKVLDRFRDKTDEERRVIIAGIRNKFPNAVVSISVTYYTGMVDTVAHVPDRCVTADGYEPKSYETASWPIGRDLPPSQKVGGKDDVEVRYINFEDQTGASNVTRSISYFFHANGEFASSPLAVRQRLAYLWEKKAYYAKIETMTTMDNASESAKVQADFLTGALPEITRCMPDWQKERGAASAQLASK